jgi:hypothetical protein
MRNVLASLLSILLLPAIVVSLGAGAHPVAIQSPIIAYADDDYEDEHEEHSDRHGEHNEEDDAPYEEVFKFISKLAVVLGAQSGEFLLSPAYVRGLERIGVGRGAWSVLCRVRMVG